MLQRFLDYLDEAAGGFIRLAYLAAGITAVALYFGAGHLPGALENSLNAALPWILAAAIETHTYSTARRVRAAWQDGQQARGALKVNISILAGLLAFSSWNQLNYLAETWTPPHTALAVPGPLAYLIRALIVPCAFMAAAFLAPLAQPITAQLESEARATLADVFRIARKQRRRLLKDAQRSGRDMTAALVELVPDLEARRVIAHAYAAIGAPVAGVIVPATLAEPPVAPSTALHEDPERPPTGPGAPTRRRVSKRPSAGKQQARILQLAPPDPPHERVRVALASEPELSIRQLARTAGVSHSTASKWRKVHQAQEGAQAQ